MSGTTLSGPERPYLLWSLCHIACHRNREVADLELSEMPSHATRPLLTYIIAPARSFTAVQLSLPVACDMFNQLIHRLTQLTTSEPAKDDLDELLQRDQPHLSLVDFGALDSTSRMEADRPQTSSDLAAPGLFFRGPSIKPC